jgi:hypothetical protein
VVIDFHRANRYIDAEQLVQNNTNYTAIMKRPESWLGRALLPLMLHRSMPVGVQDLGTLLQEMGFERIESGNTRVKMIGYLRGHALLAV